jgi:hypothetical protein
MMPVRQHVEQVEPPRGQCGEEQLKGHEADAAKSRLIAPTSNR